MREVTPDMLKWRASGFSDIMTGTGKGWDMSKSKTAQMYCKKFYRQLAFERNQQLNSKQIKKGIGREEDARTLISLHFNQFLTRNNDRIFNDYFQGQHDGIFEGEKIGYDIKCSWDITTFPFKDDELDDSNFYQGLVYIDLTEFDEWKFIHVLVNALPNQVTKAKLDAYYDMDCPSEQSEAYLSRCMEIEKNMIFDMDQFQEENPGFNIDTKDWNYDIPMSERIIVRSVKRDEKELNAMRTRAIEAKQWTMQHFNILPF